MFCNAFLFLILLAKNLVGIDNLYSAAEGTTMELLCGHNCIMNYAT